jgi:hypothetical protein
VISSVWNLEIALMDPSDEGSARAEAIIEELSKHKPAHRLPPASWEVVYTDVTEEDALRLLSDQLTEIHPGWRDVLTIGLRTS